MRGGFERGGACASGKARAGGQERAGVLVRRDPSWASLTLFSLALAVQSTASLEVTHSPGTPHRPTQQAGVTSQRRIPAPPNPPSTPGAEQGDSRKELDQPGWHQEGPFPMAQHPSPPATGFLTDHAAGPLGLLTLPSVVSKPPRAAPQAVAWGRDEETAPRYSTTARERHE